jgi:PAS domain-containing protein
MRLSIRIKQIVGVTAIVGLAVVALSALYTNRLANVVLQESLSRGQMLAKTIFHRAGGIVTGDVDPYVALREDPGLRSILESSIYGDNISFAAIVDTNGTVIVHNNRAQAGRTLAERADLGAVIKDTPMHKLRVIFEGDGQTLEVREPLKRGADDFGSIRIGVSTLLMRVQLRELLYDALFTGAAALAIAVFVAGIFAQLLLRPIHVLRSGLTRLGKGEFGVMLDLPAGDEFGELGDFFNTVSQQLSADRTLLAGQKANLQSAVEHLEDAVALFNPSGELLFSNPAMQHTLPADAIGRVLGGLLPTGHPYRTLVEETLATRKSRGPIQIQGHPTESVPVPGRTSDAGSLARAGTTALALQTKAESKPGDEELLVTRDCRHAGRIGGGASGVEEPRPPVAHAIDAGILAQAGRARAAHRRDRA